MNNPLQREHGVAPPGGLDPLAAIQNLTRRVDRLERELGEARSIFENAAVGIAVCDPCDDCRTVRCNAAMKAMLGYQPDESIRSSLHDHLYPEDLGLYMERVTRMLDGARQSVCRELRFVSNDGRRLWVRWTGSLVRDEAQQSVLLINVVEDISDLKRTEQRLLSDENLLRQLIDLQDRERQMLAYELHDGLIQYIAGVQMSIQSLEASAQLDPRQSLTLTYAATNLARAMNEGRRLIGELRPMCLEQMSIVEAVAFLVHEEEAHGDTQLTFIHRVQSNRFDPLLENTIFRIVQESLTNIRRHSRAERAEIRFTEIGNRQLVLEVQDWGIGFDVDRRPKDRFGLESICERARLMGGGATIESTPGEGTRISVRLPSLKNLASSHSAHRWTWTV